MMTTGISCTEFELEPGLSRCHGKHSWASIFELPGFLCMDYPPGIGRRDVQVGAAEKGLGFESSLSAHCLAVRLEANLPEFPHLRRR